jgi:3-methyladenine DNA glycosylase AlkC
MATPLKDRYDQTYIDRLSNTIQHNYHSFNKQQFQFAIFNDMWQDLELKDRMHHIAKTVQLFLPKVYGEAITILKATFSQMNDANNMLENMVFQDFVEQFGLDFFEISMDALEHFTQNSSSEFAIRAFILRYPEQTMQQMKKWAGHTHDHVRRLATEGCRPRLPWAIALEQFKTDPTQVVEILELLKDDSSEYVRKSVANNLNDISKDHPTIVQTLARSWLGFSKDRDKLVKHGCRSLLKAGDSTALSLFGYSDVASIQCELISCSDHVEQGKFLTFSFTLNSEYALGQLRLEYAIDFLRKNGSYSTKVFKISEIMTDDKQRTVQKSHSFKPISTRNYYSGEHFLTIIINGQRLIKQAFILI